MNDRDTYRDELATSKTQVDLPAIPRDAEDRVSVGDLRINLTRETPRQVSDRELLTQLVNDFAVQHAQVAHMLKAIARIESNQDGMAQSIAHVRDHLTMMSMARATSSDELTGTVLLMVEDNKTLVGALRRVLTEAGAAVHVASTASEGRARVELLRDVLTCCVFDVHLPDEHGFGLAQSVRHRLPRVGIVLTSGWDDHDLEEAAHRLRGAALYKSFDSRSLIDAVHVAQHLAGERAAE